MKYIPPELRKEILKYLSKSDFFKCFQISKFFHVYTGNEILDKKYKNLGFFHTIKHLDLPAIKYFGESFINFYNSPLVYLTYASSKGNLPIVKYFFRNHKIKYDSINEADRILADSFDVTLRQTPLDYAITKNHPKVAIYLFKHQAPCNKNTLLRENNLNYKALFYLCDHQYIKFVDLMDIICARNDIYSLSKLLEKMTIQDLTYIYAYATVIGSQKIATYLLYHPQTRKLILDIKSKNIDEIVSYFFNEQIRNPKPFLRDVFYSC